MQFGVKANRLTTRQHPREWRALKHDPEKWIPVSRLREAVPAACILVRRFGGRRQVEKDHAKTKS
jgi:hypothetical protein